ncbi:DEAD/DEAH box helicase [Thalassovita sp.]|uniref:DEAD/DEAH box helicase n=1 Tax=Thalassovita sp. TaxID=1979401 RepID=UPI0029DE62BE|nr:DEAD/DEAH box helicase [Thalassovita sp.]
MITPLSEALAERGYTTLTDVQQAVTAPELAQSDLLVSAQTGSGKTVGFGLAIAGTLLGDETHFTPAAAPLALIVAPTRELAMQVTQELGWLYARTGARIVSCIGGMDARNERRALERGAHIVVGTPGRLRDHITRGALDLADIRAIVLDEADEMLDLGFREDLEFMLAEAPADRRTLLFSATVPPSIAELAKSYQRDAERVTTLTKGQQHADIEYQAVQVSAQDVEHAIINLLRFHDAQTAIVFANTRAAVARLAARFANRGFLVVSLSGELSQDERSHALQALRDGRARVCVATDVAARGIDLPNLELVVHADLPTNTETLLHRSGRTGRAGRKGISALIVPDKAAKKAGRLLKWAKIEAAWNFAPSPEDIRAKDEERLLADPAWHDAPEADEAEFAAKLQAQYTPDQIATACLRLYRTRLSAPEELNAVVAAPQREAREPRRDFGPSVWVSLSVGRDRNAEPRWLLPMLCRAGNLEKASIGKIRVGETESYVELSQDALAGFMNQIGPDGQVDEGIRALVMDAEPPEEPRRGPQKPRFDRPKPHRKGDRPDRTPAPRNEDRPKPRKDYPERVEGKPRPTPRDAGNGAETRKPRPVKAVGDKPVKPARAKPAFNADDPSKSLRAKPRPMRKPDARGEAEAEHKPRPVRSAKGGEAVPRRPRSDGGKGGFDKPRGAPKGRPQDGKPCAKGAKPGGTGKPGGKPGGKPPAKGGTKPRTPKR